MVKATCALCNRAIEIRNEDVYVSVDWVMEDVLKKNNVPYDKALPRVVKLCKKCWGILEDRPQGENTYWMFHKDI